MAMVPARRGGRNLTLRCRHRDRKAETPVIGRISPPPPVEPPVRRRPVQD